MTETTEWFAWKYTASNGLIVSCSALHLQMQGPGSELSRPEWWCGYCTLPRGCQLSEDEAEGRIDVHGGVTSSERDADGRLTVGFDTAHLGDERRGWTLETTKNETERMAEQVAAMTSLLLHLAEEGVRDER